MNLDFYKLNDLDTPSELFETMSDSIYFAKNIKGEFVYANQLFLQHFNIEKFDQVLGKTDLDILPKSLGIKIQKDDQVIIKTGQSISNIVELVPNESSAMRWYVTSKSPLRNRRGEIVGIEGVTRDLTLANKQLEPYSCFKEIVDFIQHNYDAVIEIQSLADMLHMSISTFERQFKTRFGCAPSQFIKKTRIAAACKFLRAGETISQTANKSGFCDQSYFTKEFKKVMGFTPKQFQKHLASGETQVKYI